MEGGRFIWNRDNLKYPTHNGKTDHTHQVQKLDTDAPVYATREIAYSALHELEMILEIHRSPARVHAKALLP